MSKETLEEAAVRISKEHYVDQSDYWAVGVDSFKRGAKWQAERMYSEDDLKSAFYTDNRKWSNRFQDYIEVDFDKWFEQFKKK